MKVSRTLILLFVLLDKGLVWIFIVLLAPFLLSPDKQNIKGAYNCIFLSAMPIPTSADDQTFYSIDRCQCLKVPMFEQVACISHSNIGMFGAEGC